MGEPRGGKKLVPEKLKHHFEITMQKVHHGNTLTEGTLVCCDPHDFEVYVTGQIKHGLVSKLYLTAPDGTVSFAARCKTCGKELSVFNSAVDGYEPSGHKSTLSIPQLLSCPKCSGHGFSVGIRYEYPDAQELEGLKIAAPDNAFTWIWITLKCRSCGTVYRDFISFECA